MIHLSFFTHLYLSLSSLSLLKVSTLMALNKSDEAIEMLKKIISAHFRKSNDLKMDGGMTVISE